MSQWVASKPEGLRLDGNLSNGVYVGTYKNNLSTECNLEPTPDDTILGECSQPVIGTTYIDDEKGEVYIPVGDKFLKLDKNDGIQKNLPFKDRLKEWWESSSKTLYGYELKYIFRGAEHLKIDEFPLVERKFNVGTGVDLDLAGYVLETLKKEGQTQFDWQRDSQLIFHSALTWINNFGIDEWPLYLREGFEMMQKLATNRDLPIDRRLEAASLVLFNGGSPEQKEAIVHQLDEFVADTELNPASRLSAAKKLHSFRNTTQSYQTILAFAVEETIPSPIRYDAAEFAYNEFHKVESRPMVLNAMLGLANDSTADPDVRMKALYFLENRVSWGQDEDLIDPYINITKDKVTNPDLRLKAAKLALHRQSYYKKGEIVEALLDLAKDRLIEDGDVRYDAVETAYMYDATQEDSLAIMLALAKEEGVNPNLLLKVVGFIFARNISRQGELFSPLLRLANDKTADGQTRDQAISKIWLIAKTEDEIKTAFNATLDFGNEEQVASYYRYNAVMNAYDKVKNGDPQKKARSLEAMSHIADVGFRNSSTCLAAAEFVYDRVDDKSKKESLLRTLLTCKSDEADKFVFLNPETPRDLQKQAADRIATWPSNTIQDVIQNLNGRNFNTEEKLARVQLLKDILGWFYWTDEEDQSIQNVDQAIAGYERTIASASNPDRSHSKLTLRVNP